MDRSFGRLSVVAPSVLSQEPKQKKGHRRALAAGVVVVVVLGPGHGFSCRSSSSGSGNSGSGSCGTR